MLMKNKISVTFFSNFLLHHQTPFCNEMVKRLGDNFHFVATVEIPEERVRMGYKDFTKESYAINAYESEESFQKALELGRNSDVVILGDAPDIYIEDRLKENKLTFRYNERFFKQGKWRILDPRVFIGMYKHHVRYRKRNLHMLCASAYTTGDCNFIFSYPNRAYKWGYFTEVKEYQDVKKIIDGKKKNSILCVFRLIPLKHPEVVIKTARDLLKLGVDFQMELVGEGVMEPKLRKMISKYKLQDNVKMTGFVSPEEVKCKMEKADIFLFTSDKNEGWGAVINESLSCACAVIGSKDIGSVPYLIEEGKTGLTFSLRKRGDLTKKVLSLINDEKLKKEIQFNGYQTMVTTWNAKTATERLLNLIDDINGGKEVRYDSGPCSRG